MAIMPMKQTVTINRSSSGLDDWGNPIPGEIITLNCRIEEGTTLNSFHSGGLSNSEIIMPTARILFDKLADIQQADMLVFTDELGRTFEKNPKQINVKRGISGKPILTEVIV